MPTTTQDDESKPKVSDTFSPEQFLGTQISEAGSTDYVLPEEGEWLAQARSPDVRRFTSDKNGETYTVVEIAWDILDEKVKAQTGLDKPIARQSLFLDLTPQGGLDFGKNRNVALSRLRAALGQNKAGKPWSFSHITGGTAIIRVKHESDKNGDPRAVVKGVASQIAATDTKPKK